MMVLLFVLFPRIGPLWGVPQDGISTTGLSNTMRMGSVAEVAHDESVAMRMRFDGTRPPDADVLPRAGADALRRHRVAPARPAVRPRRRRSTGCRRCSRGQPLRYEMTLEPLRVASLPLLEATTEVEPVDGYRSSRARTCSGSATGRCSSGCASRPRPIRATRTARSRRSGEIQESLRAAARLQPAHARLGRGAARASRRTATSTRPASPPWCCSTSARRLQLHAGARRVRPRRDRRVLARPREGFCEHFAAAFVVVMRAAGVPARIVTGYQGADASRSTATTSCARARRTPGPSTGRPASAGSAPTRPPRSRPTASAAARGCAAAGLVAGAIAAMSPELLASLRSAWEALNNRWNQWVLNYSRGQQLDVLKNLGFTSPTWEDLALLLIGMLSSLALAGAAWAWWDRHRVDPWVRQMERLEQPALARHRRGAARAAAHAGRARARPPRRARRAARRRARRARDAALRPRRGAAGPTRA